MALPCKGAVYPEIITDAALLRGKTNCIPQWRKMLKEIAEAGVEVLDLLPEFQRRKPLEKNLYLKDHRISPTGAKIVGEQLGDYLCQTVSFDNQIELKQEKCVYYEKRTENCLHQDYTYIWRTFWAGEDEVRIPYVGEDKSKIGLIGNCNLQAYWEDGGGILANAAFKCRSPIQYVGRFLPFDGLDDPVTAVSLEKCLEHDVIVYVGFPSAAYVRTSNLLFARLARGQWFNEWSSVSLR